MQRIPFQSDSFLESSPSSGGIFRDAVACGLFCSCEEHLTINPVIILWFANLDICAIITLVCP